MFNESPTVAGTRLGIFCWEYYELETGKEDVEHGCMPLIYFNFIIT